MHSQNAQVYAFFKNTGMDFRKVRKTGIIKTGCISKDKKIASTVKGIQTNYVIGIPHANVHMLYIPVLMLTNWKWLKKKKLDKWLHGHICSLLEWNRVSYTMICPLIDRFGSNMLGFRENRAEHLYQINKNSIREGWSHFISQL